MREGLGHGRISGDTTSPSGSAPSAQITAMERPDPQHAERCQECGGTGTRWELCNYGGSARVPCSCSLRSGPPIERYLYVKLTLLAACLVYLLVMLRVI